MQNIFRAMIEGSMRLCGFPAILLVMSAVSLTSVPSFAASGDAVGERKPQMSPWPVTQFDAFRPLNEIQILPRSQATGWVKAVGMIRNPELAMPSTGFLVNECKPGEPSYVLTNYHVARGARATVSMRTPISISFGQGDKAHDYFETTIPIHPLAGGWIKEPDSKRSCADDWILMRSDTCLADYGLTTQVALGSPVYR